MKDFLLSEEFSIALLMETVGSYSIHSISYCQIFFARALRTFILFIKKEGIENGDKSPFFVRKSRLLFSFQKRRRASLGLATANGAVGVNQKNIWKWKRKIFWREEFGDLTCG